MTETIFCPYCGAENKATSRFCHSCGANFSPDPDGTPKTELAIPSTPPSSETKVSVSEQKQPFTVIHIVGTIALIFGFVNLFIFSWLIVFTPYWTIYVFMGFAAIGIILSFISSKNKSLAIFSGLMNSLAFAWFIILIILIRLIDALLKFFFG